MVTIREVKSDEKKIIDEIVTIHLNTFTGFFLTFMGRGFLRQMYQSYCDHEESGLLVAEGDGKTVGFLAYSSDFSGLYKFMIKTRLVQFGWYSMGAFFRRPSAFLHIIKAFLKPSEVKHRWMKYCMSRLRWLCISDRQYRGFGALLEQERSF